MFNVGTFYHFKDTGSCYHDLTRQQIYKSVVKGKESSILKTLLLFFLSFYLKQIFEDVETEQYNLKLANVD